jgi:hypothetical protein
LISVSFNPKNRKSKRERLMESRRPSVT